MPDRSKRVSRILAAVAVIGIVVGGCSSSSSTPVPEALVYASGTTTAQVTGAYSMALAAPLVHGTTRADVGASLQFSSVQFGSVLYQGPGTPGTYTTERTDTSLTQLSIQLVLSNSKAQSEAFASTSGECSITITQLDRRGGSGTYTCTNMPSTTTTATINAQGSFQVVGPPQ
jgi:hypothetical protein